MRSNLLTLVLIERDYKMDQEDLFNDKQKNKLVEFLTCLSFNSFIQKNNLSSEEINNLFPKGLTNYQSCYATLNDNFHIKQINTLKETYSLYKITDLTPTDLYSAIIYNNLIQDDLHNISSLLKKLEADDTIASSLLFIELEDKLIEDMFSIIPNCNLPDLIGAQIGKDAHESLDNISYAVFFLPLKEREEFMKKIENFNIIK